MRACGLIQFTYMHNTFIKDADSLHFRHTMSFNDSINADPSIK